MRLLGIDVSRYQPSADYKMLAPLGVKFVVAKATQGDYWKDDTMSYHAEGAHSAGMAFGLYLWNDPNITAQRQADFFAEYAKNVSYDFIAVDVEQQWQKWDEFYAGNIKAVFRPEGISANAEALCKGLEKLGKNLIVYTRTSFVMSYAKPMLNWMFKYPGWYASYPYKRDVVKTSWQDFLYNHQPSGEPFFASGWPADKKKWAMWQFTGDKFVLPGVYSDVRGTRDTALDINYWNGTSADLEAFCKRTVFSNPQNNPQPKEDDQAARILALESAIKELDSSVANLKAAFNELKEKS